MGNEDLACRLQAAVARKTDYVVVDTAGRLHTKTSLMAELEKMRRTAQRIIPGAPHETLLVMDATTGKTVCSRRACSPSRQASPASC